MIEKQRPDMLDVVAVAYLVLPLGIFLIGWIAFWAELPLLLVMTYALTPLAASARGCAPRPRLAAWQVAIAIAVGCIWTLCGGIGHWVFANADWHIRDAVLHDLVTGTWPVGYAAEGGTNLLRAPIGYYLPAALLGKGVGLAAAHVGLAVWTAAGAALFLLQVVSLMPRKVGATLASVVVIVAFSGLDAVGTLLRVPGAIAHWDITRHLEWWAQRYQYSSATTQLFWVPNHALGGWLVIGLLSRNRAAHAVEPLLPMTVVAVALWSPLAALGLVPFVLLRMCEVSMRERTTRLLHPRVWAPALAVGLVIAAYLTLDAGQIPKGWTIGRQGLGPSAIAQDLWRQAEFFLLEAGALGLAILSIRPSGAVVLALAVLAVLPVVSFGPSNDFVMRVSIPCLTVLAIGACHALLAQPSADVATSVWDTLGLKKALLAGLLLIGAITPFQEFTRAAVLDRWAPNLDATLIDAMCGVSPPHYVARLSGQAVVALLRPPRALPAARGGLEECENPAVDIERRRAESFR